MNPRKTYRRIHLAIVVHGGKRPREERVIVPVQGDIVTDAEIKAGRVSVYCTGVEVAKPLPPGFSIGPDEAFR